MIKLLSATMKKLL